MYEDRVKLRLALEGITRDPGYPYEMLTSTEVANVQRLRDEQMIKLQERNREFYNELRRVKRRLDQILGLTREAGWDIDVMLATKRAFAQGVTSYDDFDALPGAGRA
jgi:hypothetical protein